ncbi:SAV_6107 family HEPN domain-containing protein [Cryptosporangium minutisporangium]|uniref:SAV-6107-like HEPN domain-containing protein n=1 Tax=Cryptosporangium minutisporangium TaxID=113569 RepID=A0ABP6T0C5_9ACTN
MTYPVPVSVRPSTAVGDASGGTPVSVPASALPHRTPRELLALARHGLGEAAVTQSAGPRYATAHLAALRAAAAVLAVRARPLPPGVRRPRSRPTSVWVLLTQVAPEMGEWAAFFATAAVKRAAAEAGLPRAVTTREADDLLRDAERFCALVETTLGFPAQLPESAPRAG